MLSLTFCQYLVEKITQEKTIIINGKNSFINISFLNMLDKQALELKIILIIIDFHLAKFTIKT